MIEILTKEDCKKMLSKVGFKLGVSPNLIATRLLSDEDKQDMLEGILTLDALAASVEVWRDMGMPDYAHNKTEPYEAEKRRIQYEKNIKQNENEADQGLQYRKPFIEWRVVEPAHED